MSVNKVTSTGDLEPIAGATYYSDAPIASILPYGGATSPQGWLLCQGQSLLRTDYPELFAVIGTSFGSVDSTHFNIPDLRDKFPEGASNTNTLGSAKSAGLPNITGNASLGYNDSSAIGIMTRNANGAFVTQKDGSTYWSGPAANIGTYDNSFHFDASRSNSIYGKSTTVQPPAVCVNYIIKATTISLPSDFEDAVDEKIKEVTTPNLTALTAVTRNIANDQTYLNQNIFTIPADARRVFFSMAGSGNIGGYVELVKGIQGYARDFNNISEALVTWTNSNVVHISYIYNHTGEAKDITFQCRYLA